MMSAAEGVNAAVRAVLGHARDRRTRMTSSFFVIYDTYGAA